MALHTDAPRGIAAVFFDNRSRVAGEGGTASDDVAAGGYLCISAPAIDRHGNFQGFHPLISIERDDGGGHKIDQDGNFVVSPPGDWMVAKGGAVCVTAPSINGDGHFRGWHPLLECRQGAFMRHKIDRNGNFVSEEDSEPVSIADQEQRF